MPLNHCKTKQYLKINQAFKFAWGNNFFFLEKGFNTAIKTTGLEDRNIGPRISEMLLQAFSQLADTSES